MEFTYEIDTEELNYLQEHNIKYTFGEKDAYGSYDVWYEGDKEDLLEYLFEWLYFESDLTLEEAETELAEMLAP